MMMIFSGQSVYSAPARFMVSFAIQLPLCTLSQALIKHCHISQTFVNNKIKNLFTRLSVEYPSR